MSKRSVDSDDGSPYRKRQRLTVENHDNHHAKQPQSLDELQALLNFDNDQPLESRISAIKVFQKFLDNIRLKDVVHEQTSKRILFEYLGPQLSNDVEPDAIPSPDIINIWQYALSINSENLFSSTVSVLAFLLKSISALHEFRDIGNALCRVILLEANINLIQQGLSANTNKEHLISPTLRLLKEIVLFDGGRAAKAVYRLRHVTLQRLDVFLNMRSPTDGDKQSNRRKTAVRSVAMGYVIANLRLQSQSAKCYVLGQHRTIRALFQRLEDDPPGLILGIVDVLTKDVVQDVAVPISIKGRIFNEWSLGRIAVLYGLKDNDGTDKPASRIAESTHSLLLSICTLYDAHAVLDKKTKMNSRVGVSDEDGDSEDDGPSSLRGTRRPDKEYFKLQSSVKSFLRGLRPYADTMQQRLILQCFKFHPQLIDDYFTGKAKFSFEPKLTATWIGYARFMMALTQDPLSNVALGGLDDGDDPQLQRVASFILPPPLDQQVLTRCFNQSSSLITYLTTRILVASLEKVLGLARLGPPASSSSDESSVLHRQKIARLTPMICGRLPATKCIATQLKACPVSNNILCESITRLLELYHVVAPQLALAGEFDVSPILSATMIELQGNDGTHQNRGIALVTLDHVVSIAQLSPNTKWWHKPDLMPLSTLTMLLKLHTQQPMHKRRSETTNAIRAVLEEEYILWNGRSVSAYEVFILSLDLSRIQDRDALFAFLDNCFLRLVKKAEYYHAFLPEDSRVPDSNDDGGNRKVDLLLVVAAEQLSYLGRKSNQATISTVVLWLRTFMDCSMLRGVDTATLGLLRDKLSDSVEDDESRSALAHALRTVDTSLRQAYDALATRCLEGSKPSTQDESSDVGKPATDMILPGGPPAEDADHRGLSKWAHEDVQDAITDGAIADLILCLCSEHRDIRTQALSQVRNFSAKLEHSGYAEWLQTRLLLGELVETAETIQQDQPLPYFAGVLASRLLLVLADPLHFLYEKTNRFLNRSPEWSLGKLPSYWVDKTLMQPPADSETHLDEVNWLLDLMVAGLRTPQDMELYRRCQVIERLIALTTSEHLPIVLDQIMDLLFRCTYVEGSTMLITRCGLDSWIEIQLSRRACRPRDRLKLEALQRRARETCDQVRVEQWSHHVPPPT